MTPDHPSARWLTRVRRGGGPLYLALADALGAAVAEGELQAGEQLPPQRAVAALLGVDFTTVTRAYGEARARGLVDGAVGRGTFVRARRQDDEAGVVDLSMNLPPPPDGLSLSAALGETMAVILQRTDVATLMAYHAGAGSLGQRTAGASWLEPLLGPVEPERVLVAPGVQAALAALLSMVVGPGGAVVADPLTYPGLILAARGLGVAVRACDGDAEGMSPEALDALCRTQRPAALYLVPTMHNPTAATLGEQRRRDLAAVARRHHLWVVEDDPYSRLMQRPPAAVAVHAPERTFHLATLAKCLTPGLRIAYLVCPPGEAARTAEVLHGHAQMPAPLMAAVATAWIRDGLADGLLAGVRREASARRAIAAEILPTAVGGAESLHVWLPLETSMDLRAAGLAVLPAAAFATDRVHPEGIRISLGAPGRRTVLEPALRKLAAALA